MKNTREKVRDTRVYLRLSYDLKKLLQLYCKDKNITISGLLFLMIQDVVVNHNFSDALDRKLKVYMEKEKRKVLCNQLYITKNMFLRVMDVAMADMLISGSVSMKGINKILDSFVEEFNNYPQDIKDSLGVNFKLTVKKLRNREFLLSHDRNFKMLKYVSKK